MKKITTDYIKNIVEYYSDIPDISINSHYAKYVIPRFIYFRLCYDFRKYLFHYSLESVGKKVGRTHSTVKHGLEVFDNDNLSNHKVYIKSFNRIKKDLKIYDDSEITKRLDYMTRQKIIKMYQDKQEHIVDMYNKEISSLKKTINNLQNNDFIKKLASLDDDNLELAKVKLDAFFKLLESRKFKEVVK